MLFMKKYLITGAAGFIGSRLAKSLLEQGHRVINIDNFNDYYAKDIKINNVLQSVKLSDRVGCIEELKKVTDSDSYKLEFIDIRDLKELKRVFSENNIDSVIHLAAMAGVRPSIQDPLLYEEVNVKGTMNILECCKEFGVKKFVMASSSSVYGNNKKVPFKETDIVDFSISPYAATKKSCEVIGHTYHYLYNIDMAMLRFFTVYGPGQRPDLAIHKFTKMIMNDIPIPFYGDGTTMRDYTFIDDIIDGVIKSIKFVEENSDVYEVFNLGESRTISLNEMVSTIEKALGKKAVLDKQPMQPGDVDKTYADITKAKELINYNPRTEFEDGIIEFVKWIKEK